MKKILLTIILIAGFALAASAQPRALGLRLGWGAELSYQHNVSGADFVEANLGLYTFNAINLASTYNFMIAQPNWTDRGEWGFYGGPGAALGVGFMEENKGYVHLAVAGQLGLEYTFWFPLQLSFDLRPQIGFQFGSKALYYGIGPALSVRYRF